VYFHRYVIVAAILVINLVDCTGAIHYFVQSVILEKSFQLHNVMTLLASEFDSHPLIVKHVDHAWEFCRANIGSPKVNWTREVGPRRNRERIVYFEQRLVQSDASAVPTVGSLPS